MHCVIWMKSYLQFFLGLDIWTHYFTNRMPTATFRELQGNIKQLNTEIHNR